jgi:flagellar hook-length control protein FliK
MSSLRISQQSRAIGAPTSGAENSRPESTDKGASFAVALGAAGAAPKHAPAWLSDQAGDGSNGSVNGGTAPLRKRSDNADKSATVAASVALGVSASTQSVPAGSTTAATAGDGNAVNSAVGSIGQTTTATSAPTSGSPSLSAAAPDTGSQPVGGTPLPGTGIPTVLEPVEPPASGQAGTLGGHMATSVVNQATVDTAVPNPSNGSPVDGLLPGAPATADASSMAKALVPPSDAPAGAVSSDADAILAATASLSPAPSTTPNQPTMPNPGVAATLSASVAALSDMTSLGQLGSGQPGFAGGGFGSSGRGHDAVGAVTSAQGDATTVAAFGADANSSATAAATPGADPTPALDETTTGAISDQVTNQLLHLVSNGSREVVMRLHPAELGDLTVRVSVSGRDVSAWFTSAQPQVQGAINGALDQLQTSLGNAGYNLAGAWVGAESSSAQQQGQSQQAWTPTSASLTSSSAVLPAAAAATSRPSPSGLNIYV